MSKKNARHRAATSSSLATISRSVSSHSGAVGRQAALVAVGSGLVLSMAVPAQAGATASDPQGKLLQAPFPPRQELPARRPHRGPPSTPWSLGRP